MKVDSPGGAVYSFTLYPFPSPSSTLRSGHWSLISHDQLRGGAGILQLDYGPPRGLWPAELCVLMQKRQIKATFVWERVVSFKCAKIN